MGVGDEKPKASYTIHRHRDRTIVSSVKQRNSHSVHVRPAGADPGGSLGSRDPPFRNILGKPKE